MVLLEDLILCLLGIALCVRYLGHAPSKSETLGLIALVFSISFAGIGGSALPFLVALAVLGLVQLARSKVSLRLWRLVGVR